MMINKKENEQEEIIDNNNFIELSVNSVKVHRLIEQYPDLSHLNTTVEEQIKNGVKNIIMARQYAKRDLELFNTYGEKWFYLGIYATTTVTLKINGVEYEKDLQSSGLWGVEYFLTSIMDINVKDVDKYVNEVIDGQLKDIWSQIQELGLNIKFEEFYKVEIKDLDYEE